MPTIVEHVENWYGKRLDHPQNWWAVTSIRSYKSPDPRQGRNQSGVRVCRCNRHVLESANVTVLRLDLPAKRDSDIDDRKLSSAEDVELLLDSDVRQLA